MDCPLNRTRLHDFLSAGYPVVRYRANSLEFLVVDIPYVPVLKLCAGVPAGWSKCPGFLFAREDRSKIRKNTWVAGGQTFFCFWRSPVKSRQNYSKT